MINFLKSISRILKGILIAAILIIFTTFMISNNYNVVVKFLPLPFEVEMKLFLLIIFSFLIGLSIGAIICLKGMSKNFFISLKNNKKIKNLEKEISKLTNKE